MPRRHAKLPTQPPTLRFDTLPPGSIRPAAGTTKRTPFTLAIPLDQLPPAGELPPGMDAETAARLHPPAEMPASHETPETVAERARWEQRRDRAHEQVERLLARYRTHEVPVNYPGAVDMARELVVMALSAEDKPCPHCGAALGPRLPREEAQARELEAQAALLTRSFAELLHREEERRLRERRTAHPLPTQGTHSGAANPAKGVKPVKPVKPVKGGAPLAPSAPSSARRRPNRSGAPLAPPTPIFSRRPPPGTAMPSGGAGGWAGMPAPALARAIARHA